MDRHKAHLDFNAALTEPYAQWLGHKWVGDPNNVTVQVDAQAAEAGRYPTPPPAVPPHACTPHTHPGYSCSAPPLPPPLLHPVVLAGWQVQLGKEGCLWICKLWMDNGMCCSHHCLPSLGLSPEGREVFLSFRVRLGVEGSARSSLLPSQDAQPPCMWLLCTPRARCRGRRAALPRPVQADMGGATGRGRALLPH